MSRKEIEEFVNLSIDKVRDNVEIVSKEELGQDFFLHISPDRMSSKKYIPIIGRRQNKTEDRTIPRVTVSDYLYGCVVGYVAMLTDAYNYPYVDDNKKKQGLYIHEIKFEQALKPNNKLVFDQNRSNEHWLVTYNEDTKEYSNTVIGKMFVTEIVTKLRSNKDSKIEYTLLVEINKPEGVKFSKNIFLNKGYWCLKLISSERDSYLNDKDFKAEEISKETYNKIKDVSATMLSINQENSFFTNW